MKLAPLEVALVSTNAEITLPRALNDKLILVASFSVSPVAPVLLCRSEPAKSTIFNFPDFTLCSPFVPGSALSTVMVKMEWDRLDSLFINVDATERFFCPASITW